MTGEAKAHLLLLFPSPIDGVGDERPQEALPESGLQESLLCSSGGAAEGGMARGPRATWKGDNSVTLEMGTGVSSSSLEAGLDAAELLRQGSHLGAVGAWQFWPRCSALGWDFDSPRCSSAGHGGQKYFRGAGVS